MRCKFCVHEFRFQIGLKGGFLLSEMADYKQRRKR
jgi:hypothetical protein